MNGMNESLSDQTPETPAARRWQKLSALGQRLGSMLMLNAGEEALAPGRILCAAIERGGLAIVYGTRRLNRINLKGHKNFRTEDGGYPSPEFTASCLALARQELAAARAKIVLSVPQEWIILQKCEFPLTVKENLPAAVSYELDRITPLNPEDAWYDFQVLNENEERIALLLTAARADMINPYLAAAREKDLAVAAATFFLSGVKSLFQYDAAAPRELLFLAVHDHAYAGMLLVDGEIDTVFSDLFAAADPRRRTEQIRADILPGRDYLLSKNKSPLLVVATPSSSFAFPEQKFPCQVKMLNEFSRDALVKLAGEGSGDYPLPAAVGALEYLRPQARRFNLLSKGSRREENIPKAPTIILAALLLAMGFLYFAAPLELEKQRQEQMDRQIQSLRGEVKKAEILMKEAAALEEELTKIRAFKEGRPPDVAVWKELTAVLPKSAWLTRLRITEKGIDIEGYAARATEILPKIEESPLFAKGEFSSPTVRDSRTNADRFLIKMEWEPQRK